MSQTRIIVHGARGRMGRRIAALAAEDERFAVAAEVTRTQSPVDVAADVLIDFSVPAGIPRAIAIAEAADCALLVGTTGLDAGSLELLEVSAQSRAVMIAPNTSVGVAVLAHLAAEAARRLPARFDIEITEAHHARKVDRPSGTALRLVDALETGAGRRIEPEQVHAIRAGDIVGEHVVLFAGDDQVIRLEHAASSRDVFARGALDAAAWLRGRPAGRYSIEQAIGLETVDGG